MSTLVTVLRTVSLLAFAGSMLIGVRRSDGASAKRAHCGSDGRTPMVANFGAVGLFLICLVGFSGSSEASTALPLAFLGCLTTVGSSSLVLRSRAELGSAWSFEPKASESTGLVTTGPYRVVRHPIYLGLALFAMGASLAFSNWLALIVVLSGIVPTFAWRARVEERVLGRAFGGRYEAYRRRTRMIIPYLL